MKSPVARALFNSYSYLEYKKVVSGLLAEGMSTGNMQSEELFNYTALNEARMKRLDKTIVITEEIKSKLKALQKEYIWLVIAEGWCGDAAQILPVLNKMTLESNKIKLKIIFRDSNDDLMNQYLTNGGRAIPKLLVIDKELGKVCCDWGPRPKGAINLIVNYKEQFGKMDDEGKTQLQLWYLKDKGLSVQEEVVEMMYNIREGVCV